MSCVLHRSQLGTDKSNSESCLEEGGRPVLTARLPEQPAGCSRASLEPGRGEEEGDRRELNSTAEQEGRWVPPSLSQHVQNLCIFIFFSLRALLLTGISKKRDESFRARQHTRIPNKNFISDNSRITLTVFWHFI